MKIEKYDCNVKFEVLHNFEPNKSVMTLES